jgi:hypothetical protein
LISFPLETCGWTKSSGRYANPNPLRAALSIDDTPLKGAPVEFVVHKNATLASKDMDTRIK